MPRSDAIVFYSSDQPAFVYPSDASISADASSPSAPGTSNQIEVNITGAQIAGGSGASASELDIIVVAASGGDFTSFNAAIAAANPGDIIEGRAATPGGTFTDNTAVTANNSGTNGNRIVVRGRSGDTIVMTGTTGAKSSALIINGDYIDFGEGIVIDGQGQGNGFIQGPASNHEWAIIDNGNNNIIRGRQIRTRLLTVASQGNNLIVADTSQYIVGGLDKNDGRQSDYGDGIAQKGAGTSNNLTILRHTSAATGHGSVGMNEATGNVYCQYMIAENLWDQEDADGHTDLWKGNRTFNFADKYEIGLVQDYCLGPAGQPYEPGPPNDAPTQAIRLAGADIKARYGLIVESSSNGGTGINTNLPAAPAYGFKDVYICYQTITKCDGEALTTKGSSEATTQAYENMNYANCLFWDNNNNGRQCNFETASGTPGRSFTEAYTILNCAFPAGSTVRINDLATGTTSYTVAQLNALPNCSGNFEITDPLFVDDTTPRLERLATTPVTIPLFAMADLRERYLNFRPQNTNLIGSGAALTTVSGSVSNSTTVNVVDAGWFFEGDWSGEIEGDIVYFEGVGTRQITAIAGNQLTVDSPITLSGGEEVNLGSLSAPNVGWYQEAGRYT